MAAVHHFQPTIGHVGLVDRQQDGQMLDVLDVSVCRRIDMRSKPSCLLQ